MKTADALLDALNELRDEAEIVVTIAAAEAAGIFRGLATGDATPAELAGRVGLDARAVGIVLPVLEEAGLLTERESRYALTDAARRRLADPDSADYIGGGLGHWLNLLGAGTRLPDVLRTGAPDAPPATDDSRAAIARFMAAMAAPPAERVRRVVRLCLERIPDARTALDLGGGPGLYARELVRNGVETTLYDRAEVIDHVSHAYGLRDIQSLHLAAGDFFHDPLPDGPFDLALISNITHAYPPAANRALLEKVCRVMRPGGVVAIADFVRGRSPRAARFAIVMLLRTEGGDTYSEEDYREWLADAGFGDVRVEDLDPLRERQLLTAVRP